MKKNWHKSLISEKNEIKIGQKQKKRFAYVVPIVFESEKKITVTLLTVQTKSKYFKTKA